MMMMSSLPRGPRSTFVCEKNASKKKEGKKKIASPTETRNNNNNSSRQKGVLRACGCCFRRSRSVGRSKKKVSLLRFDAFFVSLSVGVFLLVVCSSITQKNVSKNKRKKKTKKQMKP